MLKVPSGQTAAAGVAVVDPKGQAYPALQSLHDVAPEDALKRPAGHSAMLLLFGAQNDPEGQTNSTSHTKRILTAKRSMSPP
jgi:hypothetical protein